MIPTSLRHMLLTLGCVVALSQPTPSNAAQIGRADEIGVGISMGPSVTVLAPSSYGWPGTPSVSFEGFRAMNGLRTGARLEIMGGYTGGAQAGVFAQRILRERGPLKVYGGGGAGLGLIAMSSDLVDWAGPALYLEPSLGAQLNLRRVALYGELYYNLALGPGLPISSHLGRTGMRFGFAFGRFGRLDGRGRTQVRPPPPSVHQGPRPPTRPPTAPGRNPSGAQPIPPPPQSGTRVPPPPSGGNTQAPPPPQGGTPPSTGQIPPPPPQ